MKRLFFRAVSVAVCALTVLFSFVSCSKEPYPYDLEEYIIVPTDISSITVTEAEIEERVKAKISEALENSASETPVLNRGAAIGDIVNISFVCYHLESYTEDRAEGAYITSISDSNCTVRLGDGKHPTELENAILGKVAGDKFNAWATLPSSYTVDGLAGSNVVYECEIKSVKERVKPAYDDAFALSVSGLATVSEYEAMLFEAMKEELIFEKLLALCSFKTYPVEEVNSYSSNFISYYTALAAEDGITLEEYVAKKFFIELNEFHIQADAYAKDIVKSELLMYHLVRTYDLAITDEEYSAGAQKYAVQYGLTSASALESQFGTDYVRQTVQMDKVLAFLGTQVTLEPESVTE